MHRRDFTRSTLTIAGAATAGTLVTTSLASAAQTPASESTPAASPAVSGQWQSAEDPITVTWDTEVFGEATTSGVTGEWCVLRIPDIDRFLSFIIMLEEKYPTDDEALRDLVENDPKMEYPLNETDVSRIEVVEDNGAFGVLYTAPSEATPDQWSYSEFIPSEDGSHRTIQIWIASRRSKLDREFMEAAVASVTINGEQAVRATDIAHLFDQVEAIEVEAAE